MNDSILKLCLAPMEIVWGNKEKNLSTIDALLKKVHPETDLVILPEMFSTGFPSQLDKEGFRQLAERNTGETIDKIKNYSSKYNFAISGTFIADSGGLLFNRAFFIEPSGDEYFADKRHLFSLGGEDKIVKNGDSRLFVRYRGWNISMIVCYDIRFPVWCRNKQNEYDLLLAVANWPASRIEAWNTLLKARAMENQAYVCGVNCTGIDNMGAEYDGSSHVYNYRGKDIAVRISDDGLLYASLSKEKLDTFRQRFPFWKDADNFYLEK